MAGEVGVDLDRDAAGDSVVDRSQGADHVAVAGELERGSHVHGLIDLARLVSVVECAERSAKLASRNCGWVMLRTVRG
jgi:hypothetical protein